MADPTEEYRTVVAGAGWLDARRRGRLRCEGGDATSFLHALVTADVAAVSVGGGVYAAYLTPQGRMITDLALYRQSDHWFVDVPSGLAQPLADSLEALVFSEDVRTRDVSADTGLVSVVGGLADRVLSAATGVGADRISALALRGTIEGDGILIARTDAAPVPTYDLFTAAADAAGLTTRLSAEGAVAMHEVTAEVLRIEAGRPAFGIDMRTDTIPLEAGLLDRAISLTKGCYVGQEVIVRVLHRGGGRVARRLIRLEEAGPDVPDPGAAIVSGGRDVGRVTSAAWSPGRACVVALGYVEREVAAANSAMAIRLDGREVPAVMTGYAG